MIQQISANEFKLTAGAHTMTLMGSEQAGWYMITENASTRAWIGRNLGSCKRFDSLAAVELHYKSWKGIASLIA